MCQATVLFISIDGMCQWLASVYAGINKHWEEIVSSSASQAEIMVLEFVLCIHELMAFTVFSIYFMLMCYSKNLALRYSCFPRTSLISSSVKMFLGLRADYVQPSPPL